jgi:hypothetical protein
MMLKIVIYFCHESEHKKPGSQARTGRGIHGLPKVSPQPAMPDPYTPCGRATPQTAVRPAGRAACGRLLPPWIPLPVRACWESFW